MVYTKREKSNFVQLFWLFRKTSLFRGNVSFRSVLNCEIDSSETRGMTRSLFRGILSEQNFDSKGVKRGREMGSGFSTCKFLLDDTQSEYFISFVYVHFQKRSYNWTWDDALEKWSKVSPIYCINLVLTRTRLYLFIAYVKAIHELNPHIC
jgi:hypothetical protein